MPAMKAEVVALEYFDKCLESRAALKALNGGSSKVRIQTGARSQTEDTFRELSCELEPLLGILLLNR